MLVDENWCLLYGCQSSKAMVIFAVLHVSDVVFVWKETWSNDQTHCLIAQVLTNKL